MINYIDFTKLKKYEKTLSQVQEYEIITEELNKYFKKHTMYNIYSLALHFDMSVFRFRKHYLKSDNVHVKELMEIAVTYITTHAFENANDLYLKTFKYILTQTEVGQPILELDDKVQEANANKVIILPAKD